jgi:hypothetical protein
LSVGTPRKRALARDPVLAGRQGANRRLRRVGHTPRGSELSARSGGARTRTRAAVGLGGCRTVQARSRWLRTSFHFAAIRAAVQIGHPRSTERSVSAAIAFE